MRASVDGVWPTGRLTVCLLPADFDGVGHYRLLFPAKELSRHGGQITMPRYGVNVHPDGFKTFAAEIDKTGLPDTDTYVTQNPNTQDQREIFRSLQAAGRRIVFDIDDLHHRLPKWHPAAKKDFRWWTTMLREADLVTVSTPALADVYADYHPDIRVLPNMLDWDMWAGAPQNSESDRRLRIGWMGAANIRIGDLALLRGVIGPFLKAHPEVQFLFTGVGEVHDYLGVPDEQRLAIPGQSFHLKLLPLMLDFDIGLIPLDAGLFSDCKSDLKGMEYGAMGIPCIASPSRPYRDWVVEGHNGFLARTAKEWREHLELLVSDDGLRRAMGRNARSMAYTRRIQANYLPWQHSWGDACTTESSLTTTGVQTVSPTN